MGALSADIVVVSPHLDDAVLSLGAAIAWSARRGRRVAVVTVFAGNTESQLEAGGWDRRGGFATEGEAARARRLEDEQACLLVGAEPSWLSFSEADYRTTRDPDELWSTLAGHVADVDAVLLPGFPLTNPDHAWVSEVLLERRLPCRRIGLYAEQPYRYWVRAERPRPDVTPQLAGAVGDELEWTHCGPRIGLLPTKRRAILAYRSQVPLLGLTKRRSRNLNGMLLHETLRRGEAIAWLPIDDARHS